jgi:Double zinc ribbon
MDPTRMTRYSISNEGTGPYAAFTCDRCGREYRSTPSIAAAVKQSVTRSAFGGFLRNIPVVGDSVAQQVEGDPYRNTMSTQELATAWGQVVQYFRECPTCHEIVCVPDFDEVTGFCADDSPRKAEIEAARAQQAAATLKGVADAFGLGGAVQRGLANAGGQAQAAAAATGAVACVSCGTALAPGARFCASCGTPVAQPGVCVGCGTQLAAGARFCASCGRPVGA